MRRERRLVCERDVVVDAGAAGAEEGGRRGVDEVAGLDYEAFDLCVRKLLVVLLCLL